MHGIIVLNEVRKPLTDKVPLNLQEDDSTERTTERVAEKATERVVERATARVAERTTERVAKRATARVAPTIGDIIGSYKSLVANECLKIFKLKWENVGAGASPATTAIMGKLWQRNYFEHIIRNEKSYQTISSYIINNPNSWKDDQFFEE